MSVKKSLYSQYDGSINGEKLVRKLMHGWLRKILSTSALQKTRGRMTQNQVESTQLQAVAKFFWKKIIKQFQN